MDITLLYFEDCPNWKTADAHVRTLAAELPHVKVTRRSVDTLGQAEQTGFRGSPSVLIDGIDAFADPGDTVGLSCRIYQTPDGPAGSPTLDQLRRVLSRN